MMIGCGTIGDGIKSLGKRDNNTLLLSSVLYHLPEQVNIEGNIKDVSIGVLSSGEAQEVGGFIYEIPSGAFSRSRSLNSLKTKYESIVSKLEYSNFMTMAYVTQQEGENGKVYIKGEYDISTNEMIKPLDLAGKIIQEILGDDTIAVPVATGVSIPANNFNLTLQANEYTDPETGKVSIVFVATVVSKMYFKHYVERVKNITNYANITRKTVNIQATKETFIQTSSNSKADFLFVVDDSPSMGDDQDAVSKAGEDFKNIMIATGLDVNFAIITTDSSDYARVLNSVGIIKNDYNLSVSAYVEAEDTREVIDIANYCSPFG
jgi:acylphosphatase